MTPELFMQWKMKKIEAREADLAAQRADRAKNDRMRLVFLYEYLYTCLMSASNVGCGVFT